MKHRGRQGWTQRAMILLTLGAVWATGLLAVSSAAGGTTEHVDVVGDNTFIDDPGGRTPSVSADGRYVAYWSEDGLLVRDRVTRNIDFLLHGIWPSISADGRYVAFAFNFPMDVFVHDRLTGITELVSVNDAGAAGDRD